MRNFTLAGSVAIGIGILTADFVQAQSPARGAPGAGSSAQRFSSNYGRSGVGGGQRSAARPRSYSPSSGGTASGGVNIPGGRFRQPRRNTTPVLSEYLNLDPAFVGSFEGQYLMRTLPQQEYNRTQQQTQRAVEGLQGEINVQSDELQSGLTTTGHKTQFMNTGSYFPR